MFDAIQQYHPKVWLPTIIAGLILLLSVEELPADIFTSVRSAYETNLRINSVDSDVPNEDNDNVVGSSPNFVNLDLQVFSLTRGDLIFTPRFSPGTTEYLATTTLRNSTGSAWQSFKLEIGTGAYDGTTDTFVPQTENDVTVTNYDFPHVDSPFDSPTFANVQVGAHVIEFSDGIVNSGEAVVIRFTVDVPTNQPEMTFRGSAMAVPEPGLVWPLAIASSVLFCVRYRRRRLKDR